MQNQTTPGREIAYGSCVTHVCGSDLCTSDAFRGIPMAITVVLSVGYDAVVLETRSSVLRIAGYVVQSVASITHALELFWDSDFDLVLLCHSVPLQDRNRLTSAIRASGSHVPIATIAPAFQEFSSGLADAILESDPAGIVNGVERALHLSANGYQPR
jgi:CheY-like chemotaxis protein